MAVREGSADRDGVVDEGEHGTALEDGAEAIDEMGRELREIGFGLVSDPFALAPGLSEEDLGSAAAVGDEVDPEGHGVPRAYVNICGVLYIVLFDELQRADA